MTVSFAPQHDHGREGVARNYRLGRGEEDELKAEQAALLKYI
jgi:hypothetical protein